MLGKAGTEVADSPSDRDASAGRLGDAFDKIDVRGDALTEPKSAGDLAGTNAGERANNAGELVINGALAILEEPGEPRSIGDALGDACLKVEAVDAARMGEAFPLGAASVDAMGTRSDSSTML